MRKPELNTDYALAQMYKCRYCDHAEMFGSKMDNHIIENHLETLQN